MIMVTHHVEEIPQGFTDALLLAHGKIVAAGKLDEIVTAENLTEAFGLGLELTSTNGRYAARAS
jgi:iron complex transport system ATP-binding protein